MEITTKRMEKLIISIRGYKVLLDSDLAELYEVETRRVNEQVKRNVDRFPDDFMFQLSREEFDLLKSLGNHGGRRKAPFVFTEQGIAMLSSVLNSKRAIQINIYIMRAFVNLREVSSVHEGIEFKILELEKRYDGQFKTIFDTLRDCLVPALEKDRKKVGISIKPLKQKSPNGL